MRGAYRSVTKIASNPVTAGTAAQLAAVTPGQRLALLRSSLSGLSQAEARRRLALYGPNEPVRPEQSRVLLDFLGNFTSTLALLLWFAASIAFATGVLQLGGAILTVIVVNGLFAFLQERRVGQVVRSLMRQVAAQASVMRDSVERRLPALDLVPGDVVRLAAGELAPADCVLIEASGLAIDLSMVTGETLPVDRSAECTDQAAASVSELPCIVPAGCGVATGAGVALVWATGAESTLAGIAALVAAVQRGSSILERQVGVLARVTVIIAVLAGAATVALAALRVRFDFLTVLTFATGIIVALVPEGLLPSLSVSLAIGARRMADRGAAVRRLAAVEIVGSVTVICTDKTGTLTENRLSVLGLTTASEVATLVEHAYLGAALCNDAHVAGDGFAGDPLDVALAGWLRQKGRELSVLRERFTRLGGAPFDASRRYMAVTCDLDGHSYDFVKGAPESVLALTGDSMPPTIVDGLAAAAERGERVLLIAGGPAGSRPHVLALARFYDPPRPEVPAADDLAVGAEDLYALWAARSVPRVSRLPELLLARVNLPDA